MNIDEPSPEQSIARFKAFWVAIGVVLAIAVAGLIVRRTQAPRDEIDVAAEMTRLQTLADVREAQRKAVESLGLTYHDPEGGHLPRVSVPDPVMAKVVAALRQRTAHKTEQVIPGSRTFLDQQSKQHNPVESFLKN
jgi:hypothetical protein